MVGESNDLIAQVVNLEYVSIEFGCGSRKRDNKSIGIDVDSYDGVDYVIDVYEALRNLPDGSVDKISSYHFLEHIQDLKLFFQEVYRVLKPGGVLISVVPHFSNPFFYSDPTHKNFFGLYTFSYFAKSTLFSRKVPTYSAVSGLFVCDISLIFKSIRPRFGRHVIKKLASLLVNVSSFTKELYEEMFCWLIPCYEIKCTMRKVEDI